MSSDRSDQLLIYEAIRKVALGWNMERVNLVPGGMSGAGATRIIYGYVAKTHDNPSDEEFSNYGGIIDVGEYPDETASAELIIHEGALPSAAANSEDGFLIVPALFFDVTVFMDTATCYVYVVDLSHMNILRLNVRMETVVGVTKMEELDPENDSSPDYDEPETAGNETSAHYTPVVVTIAVRDDKDKGATTIIDAESIVHTMDKPEIRQTADKVIQKVNSTTAAVVDNKVTLGDENTTKPLVLDNRLARLILDFLMERSKIITPILMGMMPPISMPNFISLISRIQKFLPKTSYIR